MTCGLTAMELHAKVRELEAEVAELIEEREAWRGLAKRIEARAEKAEADVRYATEHWQKMTKDRDSLQEQFDCGIREHCGLSNGCLTHMRENWEAAKSRELDQKARAEKAERERDELQAYIDRFGWNSDAKVRIAEVKRLEARVAELEASNDAMRQALGGPISVDRPLYFACGHPADAECRGYHGD